MAQRKRLTFRVQNVPPGFTEADLANSIQERFEDSERASLQVSVALAPSCIASDSSSQTALVQFTPETPAFLKAVESDKTGVAECQIHLHGTTVLSIDSHFFGLTQIFKVPRDVQVTMDLVFVTGLDGNAFGSWMSRTTGLMWPRDFLGEDLPAARVMTYGYNTRLSSNKLDRFEDFCTQFLQSVLLARDFPEALRRPLVLIGHSYGTRLITKSVVRCKLLNSDTRYSHLWKSLRKVVFFVAPHRGMDTDDIETYLSKAFPANEARRKIVAELRYNDDGVRRELKDFIDLVGETFQVISIYERKPSHRLVQPDSNLYQTSAAWKRVGEAYNPVTEDSALLNLPLRLETPIPSDSDHSNMTKFDRKDATYQSLLKELQNVELQCMAQAFPRILAEQCPPQPDRPSWLLDLIKALQRLQTENQHRADVTHLTGQAERMLAETLTWVALAENFTCRATSNADRARVREIWSVLLGHGKVMQHLPRTIDLLSDVRAQPVEPSKTVHVELQNFLTQFQRLNSRLETLLGTETSDLYSTPGIQGDNQVVETVRNLVSMRLLLEGQDPAAPSSLPSDEAEPRWVPLDSLFFPADSTSEARREEKGWLQRIVSLFARAGASSLKLKPRRYGVLKQNGALEMVMVEFRHYAVDVERTEYLRRRQAFTRLGKMVLSSRRGQGAAPFPSVPLRCISEMEYSSTPCFLLVYAAEDLFGLDESLGRFEMPTVGERIWLALRYAKAVAALHLANIVHGLINPYNLYLEVPGSSRYQTNGNLTRLNFHNTTPMLAGYEIARFMPGDSDRLDVENPDWRVFLHMERHPQGAQKALQSPTHDVFALGMVMIVIGLWKPFTIFQKYHLAGTEEERQKVAMQQRKQFQDETSTNNMGSEYRAIVTYCLGRSQTLPGIVMDKEDELLFCSSGLPRASRVVDALTKLYEAHISHQPASPSDV